MSSWLCALAFKTDPLPTGALAAFSISEFPYFRRRRPDRHGRTRGFAGRRRRVGSQQIGNPLEGGEHALVLVGRRRRLGGADLERRVGSRWQRVGGGDRPRLDVDRGHRTGPDVGRTRLKVGADRRTGLDWLRLNVGGRCRQRAGRTQPKRTPAAMARSISARAISGFVRAVRHSAGTPARSNRDRL